MAHALGRQSAIVIHVDVQHAWDGVRIAAAFDIPPGLTGLVGPSGAGKTTVLNAIAGVIRPDRCVVRIDGDVLADTRAGVWVPAHARRIGYVFQEPRLFPHMTVQRNLDYARRGVEPAQVDAVIDLLNLRSLLRRRPATLSGGEKQRVALGRALMTAPRLLLLDEPLASIDQAHRLEILPFLDRLREEQTIPMVYVTHSMSEIETRAVQIVVITAAHRPG
jgi:molybdate transport system ATP-binding protein